MPKEETIPKSLYKNLNSGAELITSIPTSLGRRGQAIPNIGNQKIANLAPQSNSNKNPLNQTTSTPTVSEFNSLPNNKPETAKEITSVNTLSSISVTNKLSEGITTPLSVVQSSSTTSNPVSSTITPEDFSKLFTNNGGNVLDSSAVVSLPTLSSTNNLLSGGSYPLGFTNGRPNVNEENAQGNQVFNLKIVQDPTNPSLYVVNLKDFVASTKLNTEAEIMQVLNKRGALRIDSTNLQVGVKFVNEGGNNPKLVIDTNPVMIRPTNLSASYNTADNGRGAYFGFKFNISFGDNQPAQSNFSVNAGNNAVGLGLNITEPVKLEGNINSVQVTVPNNLIKPELQKAIGNKPEQNKLKL